MSRLVAPARENKPIRNFRDRLLDLIQDENKRNDIATKVGEKFIEELSAEFRKLARFEKLLQKQQDDFFLSRDKMDEETRILYRKMRLLAEAAEDSINDSELYACFLYLTDSLRNPILFTGWVFQWLSGVYERYKDSVVLKFVYSFSQNYYELFETLFGKRCFKFSDDDPGLSSLDRISFSDSNTAGLFVEVLRQNYKQVVSIQKMYIFLTEESLNNGNEEHRWLIEHYGKRIFPKVSKELLVDVYLSFLHARLANYFLSVNQTDEERIEGKKELKKALNLYEDNSYSISNSTGPNFNLLMHGSNRMTIPMPIK